MSEYKKIILKNSPVAGAVPLEQFLDYGEIALNYADNKIYYKTLNGSIVVHETPNIDVYQSSNSIVRRNLNGSGIFNGVISESTDSDIYSIYATHDSAVTAKIINTGVCTAAEISSNNGVGAEINSILNIGAKIDSQSGTGALIRSTSGVGAQISSTSGVGAEISSTSGVGAEISSTSDVALRCISVDTLGAEISSINDYGAEIYTIDGEYHLVAGSANNNQQQIGISRLNTSVDWFKNDGRIGSLRTTSTISANCNWTLPDRSGTVLLDSSTRSGKTIYVDAAVGTDTRTGLSAYSYTPFATIGAAVAASTTGDTVYVRAGSYIIASQISLNGKGNIYFETGTEVTVAGTVVAFLLTVNEVKTINGSANITLTNTAGVLSQTSGTVTLEYNNIVSTSTGTLFAVSGGTLNTSFASISASTTDGFSITGSASLVIRRSHTATCKQFLNCNTTGGVTIDLWTAVGLSTDSTVRVANASGFSYRGVNLNNNSNRPCVIFAYSTSGTGQVLRNLRLLTGGVPIVCENNGTFRDVFLDSIKLNSTNTSNPSISSSPSSTTIYSTTTYSNVLPHSSITVDGQYNIMTKIF